MSKICSKWWWSNNGEIYCANCGNSLNDKKINIVPNNNINKIDNNNPVHSSSSGNLIGIIALANLIVSVYIIDGISPLIGSLVSIMLLVYGRVKFPKNIFIKVLLISLICIIISIVFLIIIIVNSCKNMS